MNVIEKKYRTDSLMKFDLERFNSVPYLDAIVSDCIHPYKGMPCRQCPNCLRKRSLYWSNRILAETYGKEIVIPFCLTYTEKMLEDTAYQGAYIGKQEYLEFDDYGNIISRKNVPMYEFEPQFVYQNGRRYYFLRTSDMQTFKKRVAINFKRALQKASIEDNGYRLRWYSKGEYGSINSRPHWHCLLAIENPPLCPLDGLRAVLIHCIMKSWHNGIYKDYQMPYDLSHPYNNGKQIGVNPLIEFEPWQSDPSNPNTDKRQFAKYLTKYIAKASIEDYCPQVAYKPECFYTSTRFGASYFDSQIPKVQDNLFRFLKWVQYDYVVNATVKDASVYDIIRRPHSLTMKLGDEFMARYVSATTCFNVDGDPIPLFPYIKREVFCGYYDYSDSNRLSDEERSILRQFGVSNRKWRWNGNILPNGYDLSMMQELYDLFQWSSIHYLDLLKQTEFEKQTHLLVDYRTLLNIAEHKTLAHLFAEGIRSYDNNIASACRKSDGARKKRFDKINGFTNSII